MSPRDLRESGGIFEIGSLSGKDINGFIFQIKSTPWTEKLVVYWNVLFHFCDEFQRLFSTETKSVLPPILF